MSERVEGYAQAVVSAARGDGVLERVADELFQLGRTVGTNEELRNVLTDSLVPASRRIGVLEDLLGDQAAPATLNLVSMIIGAGRGNDLPAIAEEVVRLAAESRGQAVAEVRSAVALNEDQQHRLAAALSSASGQNVTVQVVVDADVVGGLVAQIGDSVYDGSIRTRLEKMKERLS